MNNTIQLDIGSSPALQDIFARRQPGEKVELTVTMSITRKTDESVEGSISKIEVDQEDAESEVSPSEAEPVMVVVSSKRNKQ